MKINEFSLMIAGEAGDGIASAGTQFAKACMRGGLYVFGTNDYQSTIRGGHNFNIVRVDHDTIYSQTDFLDLLIALNTESITKHINELVPGGLIIFDNDEISLDSELFNVKNLNFCPIPLRKIVLNELKGPLVMRNAVALGASFALVDYYLVLLEGVLRDSFKMEIAESNIKAAQRGYQYIKDNFKLEFQCRLTKKEKLRKQQIFLNGNDAVGLGALRAGCKFWASYPMTPSSGLQTFMAENDRKLSFLFIQPEGEIAAINMVAGASFTGVRAMTATSGGGFCLMSECLGMLGATETPAVIYMGQRTGPSTGLPTYTSQADLRFVMHASQGEFPRVIIAPGDTEECFYEVMRAFNWAEKYQLPVILLVDKYLVESQISMEPFDLDRVKIDRGNLVDGKFEGETEYKRYRFTESGISQRVLPLTGGAIVRANADEHNEFGYTSEDAEITAKMIDKRIRKLEYLAKELSENNVETTKFYGPREAKTTIVSWGSTKGPIREAMKLLSKENIAVNYLQIIYLLPFPTEQIEKIFKETKKTIIVEGNKTSQLSGLIRQYMLRDVDHKILRYDGRPFNPIDLSEKIKEVL